MPVYYFALKNKRFLLAEASNEYNQLDSGPLTPLSPSTTPESFCRVKTDKDTLRAHKHLEIIC